MPGRTDYRAAPPVEPGGRVVHGPFPVRWLRLLGGLVLFPLGLLIGVAYADPIRLACNVSADSCTLTSSRLSPKTRHFPTSHLKRVRTEIVPGSEKDSFRGVPVLVLEPEGEMRLRRVPPDNARSFERRVNARLAEGGSFDEPLYASAWLLLLGVVFGVAAVGLGVAGVRGAGRYVIEFDSDPRRLHVTRKILGIVVKRSVVSTSGVVDVRVEWTRVRDFWHSRHHPGETRGRLLLVTEVDEVPVSERLHQGWQVHRDAEQQLRTAFRLEPRAADRAEALEKEAIAMQPVSQLQPGLGTKIGLAWTGACVGAIAGVLVVGLAGILFGVFRMSDSLEGWVVAGGGGGGAVGGAALALHLASRRMRLR